VDKCLNEEEEDRPRQVVGSSRGQIDLGRAGLEDPLAVVQHRYQLQDATIDPIFENGMGRRLRKAAPLEKVGGPGLLGRTQIVDGLPKREPGVEIAGTPRPLVFGG
jgi:hypothetical protein